SGMLSQVQLDNSKWSAAQVLHQLWSHLSTERRHRTLLYYRLNSCSCWMEDFLASSNASTMVWDDHEYPHYLRHHQDSDLLGVVCLKTSQYREVLNALKVMLNQMRNVPVIVQLCESDDGIEEEVSSENILQLSLEYLMINVLILSTEFLKSKILYTFDIFPKFKLIKKVYKTDLILFPPKLGNHEGYPIRTIPDNSQPHTIVGKSPTGEIKVTGPIWKLLVEFVRYLNGTIQLVSVPRIGYTLKYSQILDLVRNNTVDIAASLRPYTALHSNLHRFSYAGMVGSWCTMLPMERTLSSQEALGRLMQTPWTWLYLVLLYGAHKLLAQRRLLRTRLFSIVKPMTHLLLLCILLGQLSALFIAPQQLNHIKNIREMEQAGVRIMGIRAEFPEYPFDLRSRYASSFLLKDGLSEVAKHRNGFNTTYAYTVTSVKWIFYNEAQSYFRHPLFRYSEDICVQKLSIFALILRENCLYHDRLGVFILHLHAAGLLRFWYRRSFFEMVEAGSIRLEDKSQPHHFQSISWQDWQYVLIIYGVALTASLAVFSIELAVYYVNVWLDNL
ncbi:hypothetical protein KR074_007000, partial [Drosophila pseudoananassae]